MINFSQLFLETQQVVNKKNLELTKKLLESEKKGFSLRDNRLITISSEEHHDPDIIPLTEMISHHDYRVSELSIHFSIGSSNEDIKRAVIKIRAAEKTICEFLIDDEVVATL